MDTERYTARLRYLCRLIARDRQGFCPINGVLIVLPITAANPNGSLDELALACKADLAEAFEVLRMRCPVLVLVSDLRETPGIRRRSSSDYRPGRPASEWASGFRSLPISTTAKYQGVSKPRFPGSATPCFPQWFTRSSRSSQPGGEDVTDVLKANSQLYRFLSKIRAIAT